MVDPSLRPTSFRSEIEGLRAIAALLVATFHIWGDKVSGGVDIFFVIAGYLITSSLFRQHAASGTLSAGGYARRLIARLFPAAALVAGVTLALGLLLLPRDEWRNLVLQGFASVTYWQNWLLGAMSVDYLAVDQTRSPVQQFWAMSVQGQFYLLWFVIFIVAAAIATRWRRSLWGPVLAIVVTASAASLAYSVLTTAANPAFAYFDSVARVWEFGLGSLAALIVMRVAVPRALARALSWLGLIGVALGPFVIPVEWSFPGWVAAIPCLSAVALLLGASSGDRLSAGSLLSARPLVWFGGLAYGFYLWHWPLLIFTERLRPGPIDPMTGAAILIAALLLAFATLKLIERPGRRWVLQLRGRALAITAAATAAALLIPLGALGGISLKNDLDAQRSQQIRDDPTAYPCLGAQSLVADGTSCDPHPMGDFFLPTGPTREDLPAIYDNECRTSLTGTELKKCSWTDGPGLRVVLIGSSHAASWFTPLLWIAQEQGWQFDSYFKGGCVFNANPRGPSESAETASCATWSRDLSAHLDEGEPYDLVITSANAQRSRFVASPGVVPSSTGDAGVDGYRAVLQPFLEAGTSVVVIRDYPRVPTQLLDCAARTPAAPECGVPASEALVDASSETLVVAARSLPGVEILDMNSWFCQDGFCPAVIGNVRVYRDTHHFTDTYARTLTPYLWDELEQLVPDRRDGAATPPID